MKLDGLDWLVIAASLVAMAVLASLIIRQVTVPPASTEQE